MNFFFIPYLVVANIIVFLMLILAFFEIRNRRKQEELLNPEFSPATSISIIVPAYNEEAVICTTIESLLRLEYPVYEIIVINDGSVDRTLAILVDELDLHRADLDYNRRLPSGQIRGFYVSARFNNLIVIDKENGGKYEALNAGLNLAQYPLFCSVDADTLLEQHALSRLVWPFVQDSKVVASAGHVRLSNGCKVREGKMIEINLPHKLLSMIQVVEYLWAFVGERIGWSRFNALVIICGAFGLYKKNEVIEIGGYRANMPSEDVELVMHLHRHGCEKGEPYKIVYVPDAICWTQVPINYGDLARQRNRWYRGLLASISLHRPMLFNPRYGLVGMLTLPYLLIFKLSESLVEVGAYAFLFFLYLLGLLDFRYMSIFFGIAIGSGIFVSFLAIILDRANFRYYAKASDFFKLLLLAILEKVGYHYLALLWNIVALFDYYLKKQSNTGRWETSERQGFQKAVTGE